MISIIIPIYNEKDVIPKLYKRLGQTLDQLTMPYEVIYINDGSKDNSLELLNEIHTKDPKHKVITFSKNFGHQAAISAGLDFANGDAIIMMDADLQDPPELILDFIQKWKKGYHVVYGVRKKRDGETFFKRITASLFYKLINKISHIHIPYQAGDFRLLDRKVVKSILSLKERNRFLRGMVSWVGFNQIGVPFDRETRAAGTTKYPFYKMLRLALDAICSFSIRPLRIATYVGFITAGISFLVLMWTLVEKIFFESTIQGWTSIMIAVLFLGGIQLITIGILGEYVGRTYEEVKNRPIYIVRESRGFNDRQIYG